MCARVCMKKCKKKNLRDREIRLHKFPICIFFSLPRKFRGKNASIVNIQTKMVCMFTVRLIILKANIKIKYFNRIFMSRFGMDKLTQSRNIIIRCTYAYTYIHSFTYIELRWDSFIIKSIYILIFYKWNWICFTPYYT